MALMGTQQEQKEFLEDVNCTYDSELTVFLPKSVQAGTLPSRNIVRIWNDN